METSPTSLVPFVIRKKKGKKTKKAINVEKIKAVFPEYYSKKVTINAKCSEKQNHMIYEAFNDHYAETINILKVKLPHNLRTYNELLKAANFYIAKDVTSPMNIFAENIKGYEDYIREFNQENVKTFLNNIDKVAFLNCLELFDNWKYFKTEEQATLWDAFGEMLAISYMTNLMPTELMTAVQDMTLEMNAKGQLDQFDRPDVDLEKAIELIVGIAQSKPLVKEGMEKLQKQVDGGSTAPQPPPAYLNMLAKIAKLNE